MIRSYTGEESLCHSRESMIPSYRLLFNTFKKQLTMSGTKIWLRAETKPAEARSACKLISLHSISIY